jgi:hypothetical protein
VLFPIVSAVAGCVQKHVLPVLSTTVPDGSLSTGEPMWKELGYIAVALASYSQNFDGNGIFPRALGGDGEQSVSTGSVPGEGQLFASASAPVVGTRPVWLGPGVVPPYRPDVPCAADASVNLNATAGPSDLKPVAGSFRPPLLSRDFRQLRAVIRKQLRSR